MTDKYRFTLVLDDKSTINLQKQLEEEYGNKSAAGREAYRRAMVWTNENPDSIAADLHTVFEDDEKEETEELVPVWDTDTESINLSDADSLPTLSKEEIALDHRDLPTDWQNLDSVTGKYDSGRKHIVRAIARHIVESGEVLTKDRLAEELEKSGLSRKTASDYSSRIAHNQGFYSHPRSKEQLFTPHLKKRIRLSLADKSAGRELTKSEQEQYPEEWGTLLPHYEDFVESRFFVQESNYLDAARESLSMVLQLQAIIYRESNSGWGPDDIGGEERHAAWSKVADALSEEVSHRLPELNGSGVLGKYKYAQALARRIEGYNGRGTKVWETPDDELDPQLIDDETKYRDLVDKFEAKAAEFDEDMAVLIEDTAGDITVRTTPSVANALTVLGWERRDLGSIDAGDVKNRFRKLVKQHHPDQGGSDVNFVRRKQDWEEARSVLLEEVPENRQRSPKDKAVQLLKRRRKERGEQDDENSVPSEEERSEEGLDEDGGVPLPRAQSLEKERRRATASGMTVADEYAEEVVKQFDEISPHTNLATLGDVTRDKLDASQAEFENPK